MNIGRMRLACRIAKPTHAHSRLLFFRGTNSHGKAPQIYVYKNIACLVLL